MSGFRYLRLTKVYAIRWMRHLLRYVGYPIGKLPRASELGIWGRLVSAFVGVASLTLVASVVAFFSYNYIAQSLHRIETEGIPVMNRALIFAREAAGLSHMTEQFQQEFLVPACALDLG